MTSEGKRLGAYLVEVLLFVVTLGIGWLVWTLIILGRGQTPAKQLMHMRVVRVDNGQAATWGKMFVREFLAKLLISLVAYATLGIGVVLYFWLTWDDKNQELWDKMVGTVVVDDPHDLLDPRTLARPGPAPSASRPTMPPPSASRPTMPPPSASRPTMPPAHTKPGVPPQSKTKRAPRERCRICNKDIFADEDDARAAVARSQRRFERGRPGVFDKPLDHEYYEPLCGEWHVSSQPRSGW